MLRNQSLEVKGNLAESPFAEVLAEVTRLKLDGSFRLNHEDRKAIVYLRNGDVVFAVSNAREHRLFQIVLQQSKLEKEKLAGLPMANDFEFAQSLTTKGLVSEAEMREIFTKQVEKIVKDLLYWQEGEWIFSILARAKDSIDYKINLKNLLFEYARNASIETIKRSFVNHEENFSSQNHQSEDLHLSSSEAFVLYRFESHPLKLDEVLLSSGLPENITLKAIYALWLGGLLSRENRIFSDEQVAVFRSIKLQPRREEVKKEKTTTAVSATSTKHHQHVDLTKAQRQMEQETEAEEKQELEAYLNRVENASNYYQVLGVSPTSSTEEIKTAYFRLARRFHPDKYHKEAGTDLYRRVQSAFGEIARAYETLKDEKSRKSYDLKNKDKIRPEETTKAEKTTKAEDPITMAKKSFEEGYELLMRKEYETAYPLLAKAVFLDPNNAQYHAYFGKLLSANERMRFRAEEEIRKAINIEPQNPLYRIMLAELYMDYGFYRRAEGELRRLLEIDPNNKQALEMLRKIPEK
jgi:curved DNA-binding protein CbpA